MLGTSEELEVSKEARVVGEVALGKRVEEREEKVRDTVRRTQVEVEEIERLAQDVPLQPLSRQQMQRSPVPQRTGLFRSGEVNDGRRIPGQVEP